MTAPPLIRQLDDRIANQIAAGEVVERPAAVVKETVENSIDAGATRIAVRIADGGRQLIEVVDDGHGMRRDDLRLALSRHATSKLRNADDLFRISSLGFRGEALPSIAAVSEFELLSRPEGAEAARIVVEGGREHRVEAASGAPGTRVSVRNLFWNVPARLKFLKSARAEGAAVSDIVTRLALGHPAVGFLLESDGKTLLDLPPGQGLVARLRAVLGKQVAEGLAPVEALAEQTQLHGFVAHPEHAKPSTKKQYVYLNGRPVADKVLVAAIREGYKGFLEPRLHGIVCLHLDTDPSLVDVNVHPTKAEIRFRRQGEVFALLRDGIQDALGAVAGGFTLTGPAAGITGVSRTVIRPAAPAEPVIQERYLPRSPAAERPDQHPAQRAAEAPQPYRAAEPTGARPPPSPAPQPPPQAATPTTGADRDLPGVRQIVQLNDMYLLVETDEGIRLLDQHALHEKALFLALDPSVADFSAGGRQEFLIPKPIELAPDEVAAVEPHLAALAELGIEAEVFGPSQLLLRAAPAALGKLNWQAFFVDLADEGPGPNAVEKLREKILHSKACRSAIKAGHRLQQAEMQELVHLLYTLEHMEHCPHGRPTTLDLSWGELERRFQR